jgi:hypothetical protein
VQQVQFDSFGERLPSGEVHTSGPPTAGSRWMLISVVGLFWLVVAAVVAARVILAVPAS